MSLGIFFCKAHSIPFRLTGEFIMTLQDHCLFCKIIRHEIPAKVLYEDQQVMAFLDIAPRSNGHALVVPKFHVQYAHELPEQWSAAVQEVICRLAPALCRAVGTTDYNLVINNGPDAGQEVPHVHVHIIPRGADDRAALRFGPAGTQDQARTETIVQQVRKVMGDQA